MGKLSGFLASRGLWIIFLEITVISLAFSFSIPLLVYLQVMWAIGWSMVALSMLVWLSPRKVLAIGLAIVALHNLLDVIPSARLGGSELLLHKGGLVIWNGHPIAVIDYPVLPWVGVMALGYGLGFLFISPKPNRILSWLGVVFVAAFFVLRGINRYGDPNPWVVQSTVAKTVMAFFNVEKYPPSLMFVCATLGPALLLFPILSRVRNSITGFLRTSRVLFR